MDVHPQYDTTASVAKGLRTRHEVLVGLRPTRSMSETESLGLRPNMPVSKAPVTFALDGIGRL